MRLIGGNISDTPVKEVGDGSAFNVGGGGGGNYPLATLALGETIERTFNGSSDFRLLAGTLADYVAAGSNEFYWVAVITIDSYAPDDGANKEGFVNDQSQQLEMLVTTNGIQCSIGGTNVNHAASLSTKYGIIWWWDGTTSRLSISGGTDQATARSGTITTSGQPVLGRRTASGKYFDGTIHGVYLYKEVPSDEDIVTLKDTIATLHSITW